MRYARDYEGEPFWESWDGFDRHNAEVAAFHLDYGNESKNVSLKFVLRENCLFGIIVSFI